LVRLLCSLIQRVGGVCQVEPSHFPVARPDLLVFLFDLSFLVDFVISHPSAPSHLAKPAVPLKCAAAAEARKSAHYRAHLGSSTLVPFAMETFGAFGKEATQFVRRLISISRDSVSSSLPSPPLFASLSVLLQKCNAYILSRGVVLLCARASHGFSSLRGFSDGFPRPGEGGVPQMVLSDRI
jgi:hypothetical protein